MTVMTFENYFVRAAIAIILLCVIDIDVLGQRKFTITRSSMSFTSDAELELIQASSDNIQGLIDPADNRFAFTVEVKTFKGFNSALQREHFNDKYMESDKFPRARFSGKIIEPIVFTTDGVYDVRAKGELDIHGQKQTRIIKAHVVVTNGVVEIDTHFFIPLTDHNISIPTIVNQKIASEIEVDFEATMSLQSL